MKNLSHGTSFSRDLPLLIYRSREAVIPSVLALSDTGQNDLLGGCRVRQSSSSTRACPDSKKIKKKKKSGQSKGFAEAGQKASFQLSQIAAEKLCLGKEKGFVQRFNYMHGASFLTRVKGAKCFH